MNYKRNKEGVPQVKFLLVDDLDENLLVLSTLLQRDDVELLLARSGCEALALLQVHDVALALIDVQMPDMDGFELAELIRGSARTRHIPLIFVTAGARDEHWLFQGYETGAVDFLYKPIEPHILRNKAEVFLQLYLQKQQLALELHERTETLRLNEMFVAVLGHDLRNPLGAVMMAATLLQRSGREEVAQKAAQQILNSGKRMAKLIDNMLDLARARQAGGIALSREQVRLRDVAYKVMQEYETTWPGRAISLHCAGDDEGSWDPERLAQVLANLLGNALKHGMAGAPVELCIDGGGKNEVVLSVCNQGVIPSPLLSGIFDPFRGGTREPGRQEGLGLGLYIAQQIVAAHGGSIEVRSNPEEQTVFTVRIARR